MTMITKAKKIYKKRFGEANHLLITVLIGIDAIEKHNILEPHEEFSTTWNPKDRTSSVQRSRLFTIQAFFSHIVDGIDAYFTTLRTIKPPYIEDPKFHEILDACGSSVYNKVFTIDGYFSNKINPVTLALIDLGVTCRNNFMHYSSHQRIKSKSQNILSNNSIEIKNSYCALDIERWLRDYTNNNFDITFKELASFIRASHAFIEEVDKLIVEKSSNNYENRALEYHLSNDKSFKIKYESSKNKQRIAKNLLMNKYGYSKDYLDNESNFISSYNNT